MVEVVRPFTLSYTPTRVFFLNLDKRRIENAVITTNLGLVNSCQLRKNSF